MSNAENLIPFNERTEDEVREIAKKGGINSGKARKEKAELKKTLLTLLESDFDIETDGKHEKIDGATAVCVSLIKKAISGDVKAFTAIRDTIGEIPTTKVSVTNDISQSVIDEVEKIVMCED